MKSRAWYPSNQKKIRARSAKAGARSSDPCRQRAHRSLLPTSSAYRWFTLCSLALSLTLAHAQSDNSVSTQQLREQIENLQAEIDANKQKKSDSLAQLRRHDLKIAKLSLLVRRIDEKLDNNQSRIQTLRQQKQQLAQQVAENRQQLAKVLTSLYRVGNQDLLRVLLSIDDPNTFNRQLNYYTYFSRSRIQLLSDAQLAQQKLQANEQHLRQERKQLTQLQSERGDELAKLRQAKQRRGEFLARLDQTIITQQRQLDDLKENLRRLQNLVTELQAPVAIEPTEPRLAFASLKGELSWPVTRGPIIEAFGSRTNGIKRQGILIAAKDEQPVYSVAGGKVLYADWLRGFGMLLIIDHGGQYMSLYGHNNALYCEKGEQVQPGQQIASVGNSGTGDKIGLYFELRYQGHPINPQLWLKR